MRVVRVGFAGVAHSHPFTDAANLRARGAVLTAVWDADDPDRRDDFATRFDVMIRRSLAELLADAPDVIVATPRTARAASVARACADAGLPVFFNKTIAADAAGVAAWTALPVAARFTSSVLRFAPSLAVLAEELADSSIHALDIHVQHDITAFLEGSRRWQDDPHAAGGTLMNLGIHAWEMLDVLQPAAVAELLSATVARGSASTASELVATVHARFTTPAGAPAPDDVPWPRAAARHSGALTLTVSGVGGADRYAVRAVTDRGIHEVVLTDDPDGLGYGGTADAILRLARGESPLPPERTAAVYRNAVAAAALARAGRTAEIDTLRGGPAPDRGANAAGDEER